MSSEAPDRQIVLIFSDQEYRSLEFAKERQKIWARRNEPQVPLAETLKLRLLEWAETEEYRSKADLRPQGIVSTG